MRTGITDHLYRTYTDAGTDRVPDLELGYWPQTIRRWLDEGLPLELTPEEANNMFPLEVAAGVDPYAWRDQEEPRTSRHSLRQLPHLPRQEAEVDRKVRCLRMRHGTTISVALLCLCSSWAYSRDGKPAGGYVSRPAPLGYPLRPLPIKDVKLADGFWAQRMKTHIEVTIPHVLKTLKIDYADPKPSISALALVRALEGAAYCLMIQPDEKLEGMMDKISANIGDLYRKGNRWFGGCPEGAVFFYFATGKVTPWLKAAEAEYRRRRQEYFDKDGKPLKEPEPHAYVGMAVVSLYMATGNELYRDLAQKFMDSRGMPATGRRLWPKFAAQHKPVPEMKEPGGHAGSFGWFASALVDVGALTGNKKYGAAAQRIWQNLVDTRMCITGGCGAVSRWEGFGEPYAIGRRGYNETCAASGQVFYNHRLFMLTRDAKYLDVMEVVLFNGLLSGVSIEGDKFFYTNVLESGGQAVRQPSRRVPCCHGSICRTIPQVPAYMYAHTDGDVYVTLYAANSTAIPLAKGKVEIRQATKYPFDGKVVLTVSPASEGQTFALRLRISTWAREKFMPGALYSFATPPPKPWEVQVNGQPVKTKLDKGFAVLERAWKPGDIVQLDLPMPVQANTCIDKVQAYLGRAAFTRGPLAYCAEEVDNKGPVQRLAVDKLPSAGQIKVSTVQEGILKGVSMISLPAVERNAGEERPATIHLVPYYSWSNRGAKSMAVWIPRGPVQTAEPLKWFPAGKGQLPKSRSGENTEVIFENKSNRRVKLHWLGYRGKLKSYGELAPGATRHQNTYAGSTWLITDENDKPLGHFVAGPATARAVIPGENH